MRTLTHLDHTNTAASLWNRGPNWPAALRARRSREVSKLSSFSNAYRRCRNRGGSCAASLLVRHSSCQTPASDPVVEPAGRRFLYHGGLSIARRANACPPECPQRSHPPPRVGKRRHRLPRSALCRIVRTARRAANAQQAMPLPVDVCVHLLSAESRLCHRTCPVNGCSCYSPRPVAF